MDNKFTQQSSNEKRSVINYFTDKNRYENKKEEEKKFLGYTPEVIKEKNVDAESDLRGITRILSRSNIDKYQPKHL